MNEINLFYLAVGFAAGVFSMSLVIFIVINMVDKLTLVTKNDSKTN